MFFLRAQCISEGRAVRVANTTRRVVYVEYIVRGNAV